MRKLAFALLLTCGMFAAEKENKPNPTFLDAKAGGQDFADQGEYKNDWGGIQVIALGGGEFRLVTYRGGLPGDGWDKEMTYKTEGELKDGVLLFSKGDATGKVKDGAITVGTPDVPNFAHFEKVNRRSPNEGDKPPTGAMVLFDGQSADAFQNGKLDENGLLDIPTEPGLGIEWDLDGIELLSRANG